VTPFYSLERDKALKVAQCKEEGTTVNTLSLYTLTPGVTSSFRDVRICEGICEFKSEDLELKYVQQLYEKDSEEVLLNPFTVFMTADALTLVSYAYSLCFLNLLVWVAFGI